MNFKPKKEIVAALNAFEAIQKRFAKYGAYDTEPCGNFHVLIAATLEGQVINWERFDKSSWELFDMSGSRGVELALTEAARHCCILIAEHMASDASDLEKTATREYLIKNAWRAY